MRPGPRRPRWSWWPGDGLLREAFRRSDDGDETMLDESKLMLGSYIEARLGGRRG